MFHYSLKNQTQNLNSVFHLQFPYQEDDDFLIQQPEMSNIFHHSSTASLKVFYFLSKKIFVFGLLGFAFGPYLPLLCSLIVCGYAGTWCGKHVLVHIPEKFFRTGLKIILTLLAFRLLYDALHSSLN